MRSLIGAAATEGGNVLCVLVVTTVPKTRSAAGCVGSDPPARCVCCILRIAFSTRLMSLSPSTRRRSGMQKLSQTVLNQQPTCSDDEQQASDTCVDDNRLATTGDVLLQPRHADYAENRQARKRAELLGRRENRP